LVLEKADAEVQDDGGEEDGEADFELVAHEGAGG